MPYPVANHEDRFSRDEAHMYCQKESENTYENKECPQTYITLEVRAFSEII